MQEAGAGGEGAEGARGGGGEAVEAAGAHHGGCVVGGVRLEGIGWWWRRILRVYYGTSWFRDRARLDLYLLSTRTLLRWDEIQSMSKCPTPS